MKGSKKVIVLFCPWLLDVIGYPRDDGKLVELKQNIQEWTSRLQKKIQKKR